MARNTSMLASLDETKKQLWVDCIKKMHDNWVAIEYGWAAAFCADGDFDAAVKIWRDPYEMRLAIFAYRYQLCKERGWIPE